MLGWVPSQTRARAPAGAFSLHFHQPDELRDLLCGEREVREACGCARRSGSWVIIATLTRTSCRQDVLLRNSGLQDGWKRAGFNRLPMRRCRSSKVLCVWGKGDWARHHGALTASLQLQMCTRKRPRALSISVSTDCFTPPTQASHNPEADNGVKLVDPNGGMLEVREKIIIHSL